jgi:hypothetical protein
MKRAGTPVLALFFVGGDVVDFRRWLFWAGDPYGYVGATRPALQTPMFSENLSKVDHVPKSADQSVALIGKLKRPFSASFVTEKRHHV